MIIFVCPARLADEKTANLFLSVFFGSKDKYTFLSNSNSSSYYNQWKSIEVFFCPTSQTRALQEKNNSDNMIHPAKNSKNSKMSKSHQISYQHLWCRFFYRTLKVQKYCTTFSLLSWIDWVQFFASLSCNRTWEGVIRVKLLIKSSVVAASAAEAAGWDPDSSWGQKMFTTDSLTSLGSAHCNVLLDIIISV